MKAKHEAIQAEMKPIYQEIFSRYEFYEDVSESKRRCSGGRITDPEKLYLSGDDKQCQAYYESCADEIEKRGYNVKRGYCPALVARSAVTDKENEILQHVSSFMGVTPPIKMELREKMIDLFMRSVFSKN